MTSASTDLRLTAHLSQFITDHKRELMEKILDQRTRYVTLVLEDIVQSQNASAAIRTCECLGLQDIHIIEDESEYGTNKKVLKGSHKWLTLRRHKLKGIDNTAACFHQLREEGYKIYVTDPSPGGVSLYDVPVNEKIALVMGNEQRGISDYAREHADHRLHIPMYGFTESFNISVSAALCLNTLLQKLRASDSPWHLTEEEKASLRLHWYRKSVRRSNLIEEEFLRSIR